MHTIPVRKIDKPKHEPPFAGNFGIRKIEDVMAGSDMIQELHRHDYFFVLALRKGKGDHVIDFTPYKIHDHSLFFMCPGQVHRLKLNKGARGFIMEFTTDFYNPHDKPSRLLLRSVGNRNHCQMDASDFNPLLSILNSMLLEHTEKREQYFEAIRANLRLFLIELVRQRKTTPGNSEKRDQHAQERIAELRELLETNVPKHKQVSDYADMMNLSTYQLNAITKSAAGKTCSDVIDEYIILEAKRYLLATTNQVNQIAWHLGYEDASYFIRFFKKHTGHSPEAFRQNLK
jgi:AraC family transcriptional regulator, transcriptional activator of pobA